MYLDSFKNKVCRESELLNKLVRDSSMLRQKKAPYIDDGLKKNVVHIEEYVRDKLNRSSVLKSNVLFPTLQVKHVSKLSNTNDPTAIIISDHEDSLNQSSLLDKKVTLSSTRADSTLKKLINNLNRSASRKRNSFQK
jgi:hypothetical protein